MSAEHSAGAPAPLQDVRIVREQVRQRVEQTRAEEALIREQVRDAVAQARAEAAAQGGGSGGSVVLPPPPTTVEVLPDGRVRVGDTEVAGPITGQPVRDPMPIPPQMIRDITMAFFMMIAFIAVGIPLIRLFGRMLDRRHVAPPAIPADVGARLDRIEQAVEAVAIEVERISEGQRFTSRLISEMRATPQLERVTEQRG